MSNTLACDVALVGTGVAPLIAATRLLAEGKRVILLNPEWDYFREDAEVGLDAHPEMRWGISDAERMAEILRPDFPGPIEISPTNGDGFHDPHAPHIRSRAHLWIDDVSEDQDGSSRVDALYLESSEAGFHPTLLDGISAWARFPGISSNKREPSRAVLVPRVGDLDLFRYRNNLLEYVRERLGPERMIGSVHGMELIPEGLRYYQGNQVKTVRVFQGVSFFWTLSLTPWLMPRLQSWVRRPAVQLPEKFTAWESWQVLSREVIDPAVVGHYRDWTVWVDQEGELTPSNRIQLLRRGREFALAEFDIENASRESAARESFESLARLAKNVLSWNRLTVRGLKTRFGISWRSLDPIIIPHGGLRTSIVQGADGPIASVANLARKSAEAYA